MCDIPRLSIIQRTVCAAIREVICTPLLCHLPTDIDLYRKSWDLVPFILFQTITILITVREGKIQYKTNSHYFFQIVRGKKCLIIFSFKLFQLLQL